MNQITRLQNQQPETNVLMLSLVAKKSLFPSKIRLPLIQELTSWPESFFSRIHFGPSTNIFTVFCRWVHWICIYFLEQRNRELIRQAWKEIATNFLTEFSCQFALTTEVFHKYSRRTIFLHILIKIVGMSSKDLWQDFLEINLKIASAWKPESTVNQIKGVVIHTAFSYSCREFLTSI